MFLWLVIRPYTHAICSVSNASDSGPVKNQIANALVQRILMAARDGQKFKVRAAPRPRSQ